MSLMAALSRIGVTGAMLLTGFAPADVARAAEGATATGPLYEVYGGYSQFRNEGHTAHGWDAAFEWNPGRHVGLTFSVGGHYRTGDRAHDFLIGPRLFAHGERLTPFAYLVAGGARETAEAHDHGAVVSHSTTGFAWALGGGIDVKLAPRLSLRAQGDYFALRVAGETDGAARFSTGLVLGFGAAH